MNQSVIQPPLPRRVLKRIGLVGLLAGLLLASVAVPANADFGIARWDGTAPTDAEGDPFTQAGGHPANLETTLEINSHLVDFGIFEGQVVFPDIPNPDGSLKDALVDLPLGLVGNPTVVSECRDAQLASFTGGFVQGELSNLCPITSQVGTAYVQSGPTNGIYSMFNMVPAKGTLARFGFNVLGTPVYLDARLRGEGAATHIAIDATNVSQALPLYATKVVFWGVPSDPAHDGDRCWQPRTQLFGPFLVQSPHLCPGQGNGDLRYTSPNSSGQPPVPFLTLPSTCTPPGVGLRYDVAVDSWEQIGTFHHSSFFSHLPAPDTGVQVGTTGCDAVVSEPDFSAGTTSQNAESPSGLQATITVPTEGLLNARGVAQSMIKKVRVTLPEGMTLNPSQGDGLVACTPAQYAAESVEGLGCPLSSKIGTVTLHTPVLHETLEGEVFVAQPHDNPFDSLIALYVVIKNPARGLLLKLPAKVELNPETGQLVTTFDDLPQLPFSSFEMKLREGGRSPLATPKACGTYTTKAEFTPWADTSETVTSESSFEIAHGVNGGPCPSGGLPPFKPGLIAGSLNNAAGHYSPFNVRLTRNDGEQEITHFSVKLPPGLLAKLAGVPFCPDGAIAAAKNRSGSDEINSASCPAASEVGHTLVGAGVGSTLVYAPGKVYLAGPYNGSSLSIAAITAAKVGPFDLGTVVVREALKINPETGEAFVDATGSDPLPHIIDGIVTHLRDIRVYIDKQKFTLNPTSCKRTSLASTVLGSGLDFVSEADDQPVTVSTPYQAADCAALAYKPKLGLRLKGSTKRGGHPKLTAHLKMKPGEANTARAQVALPHSEFLAQAHIGTTCTRVQFAAGAGGGTQCPARSIYGFASARTPLLDEPLKGPVFLRSSKHQLPDMVAALRSGRIEIHLVGRIDSDRRGGIRTTFESVPDAPVDTFSLTMFGGKRGLLENSTNLCIKTHRALAKFQAHNGKARNFAPALKVSCRKSGKGRAPHRRSSR